MKLKLKLLALIVGLGAVVNPSAQIKQDWRQVQGTNYNLTAIHMFKPDGSVVPIDKPKGFLPSWEIIWGKVIVVNSGGVVLRGAEDVFLLNYPLQSTITDGQSVMCYAIRVGRQQYRSPLGAERTVPLYDYGKVIAPPVPIAKPKRVGTNETAKVEKDLTQGRGDAKAQ